MVSKKIPLGAGSGLGAVLIPALKRAFEGNIEQAMSYIVGSMTGYNYESEDFNADRLKRGWIPLILGGAASAIAAKLNINRRLSGIPFFKV